MIEGVDKCASRDEYSCGVTLIDGKNRSSTVVVFPRRKSRSSRTRHAPRGVGAPPGRREIEVSFFDGGRAAGVRPRGAGNVAHGLPLSLSDRKQAALRILQSYSRWTDRSIAWATGLSAATVAALRRRATAQLPQSHTRVGRDGRVRPVNAVEGGRRAGRFIAEHPNASLQEVAAHVGISTSTVRDVRRRLSRGKDPVPSSPLRGKGAQKRNRPRSGERAPRRPGASARP